MTKFVSLLPQLPSSKGWKVSITRELRLFCSAALTTLATKTFLARFDVCRLLGVLCWHQPCKVSWDDSLIALRTCRMTVSDTTPSSEEWNNFIRIYAVSTVAIFTKYTLSLFYAANSGNHPTEDKMFLLPPQPDDIRRRERQFLNDMENIPVHLAIFWAAFIIQNLQNAGGSGGRNGTLALSILFLIYTISRALFTACYIHGIQPFRTIFYILGTSCVIAACICLIHASIQIEMDDFYPKWDNNTILI